MSIFATVLSVAQVVVPLVEKIMGRGSEAPATGSEKKQFADVLIAFLLSKSGQAVTEDVRLIIGSAIDLVVALRNVLGDFTTESLTAEENDLRQSIFQSTDVQVPKSGVVGPPRDTKKK